MTARPLLKSHPLPRLRLAPDSLSDGLLRLLSDKMRAQGLWDFERQRKRGGRKRAATADPAPPEKERLTSVGLNSVLRALESGTLVLAILDSRLVAKPGAVASFLSAAAARSPATTAFALPALHALAPTLGLRSLAAIGFQDGPETQALVAEIRALLDSPPPPSPSDSQFLPMAITPVPKNKNRKRKK